MYPSIQKAYAGIFVKNQYEELLRQKKDKETVAIFFMRRTFTSKLGSVFKYFKTFLKFIPLLFKKYDCVHLHYFFPMIVLAWLYKKLHPNVRLFVTFHGSDINLQVTKKNEKLMRFFAKEIDVTIPVGKQVSKNVVEKLKLPIGEILPVGIDNTVFYVTPETPKTYDIIFVGSFFNVKGIDILYNTIKKLPKQISYCVVGKGEEYEEKFKNLKAEGYLLTLKIDQSQEQLRKLYNSAKFLFQPSRSEGFPTVTLEAMYCGTPVITSNIPQFLEQVEEGANGFTFQLNNEDTAVNVILKALETPKEAYSAMCVNALNSFKEISLYSVCAKLWTLYRS